MHRTAGAGDRKKRVQPLSQEHPRAVHTLLDGDDGEAEGLGDFLARESLDIAQQHNGAVVGGQFLDADLCEWDRAR